VKFVTHYVAAPLEPEMGFWDRLFRRAQTPAFAVERREPSVEWGEEKYFTSHLMKNGEWSPGWYPYDSMRLPQAEAQARVDLLNAQLPHQGSPHALAV
jgi:hypothetical protein